MSSEPALASSRRRWTFEADGNVFKLAAEALRL